MDIRNVAPAFSHSGELQTAASTSRPLLRFETESFSDSDTTRSHYGFPDDQDLSGTAAASPHRLSRTFEHRSQSGEPPARHSTLPPPSQQQPSGMAAWPAAADAEASISVASAPGTSEITAAPLVAAPPSASNNGAADQPPQQLPGRKYHSLWRVRASGAGASAPNLLSEPLVVGRLHVRTARSEAGSDIGSVHIAPRSRANSHRALTEWDREEAAKKWAGLHMLFAAWLCASLVTVIASWWWFPLGVIVGGTGVLGGISALRHNPDKIDLVQPARGVQWLGVMTGLLSCAAAGVIFIAELSVDCHHVEQCSRLRFMLAFLLGWFLCVFCVSTLAAHYATKIIQKLQPTFYMRQSEVAVPEADTGGLVTLREETFTPRATSQTLEV